MNIPQIQISQTLGQISIRQNSGGIEIEQPKAQMEIKSDLPDLIIEISRGGLEIDQKKAWAAYGIMSPLETRERIYSQVKDLTNQWIAQIAQKGDQMAAIHKSTDVIAELAQYKTVSFPELNYVGEASSSNVDLNYQPDQLSFHSERAQVDIQVLLQKPIIKRIPAQVHIGMERYQKLQISVAGQNVNRTM